MYLQAGLVCLAFEDLLSEVEHALEGLSLYATGIPLQGLLVVGQWYLVQYWP